jgi:hypothetical protein
MKAIKALVFALLLLLPMAAVGQTAAQDPSTGTFSGADDETWYTTVQGVLDVTGEMPLFPYYHGTVKIGLSKFGETVNPFPVVNGVSNGVGFQYTGADLVPYDPIVNPTISINRVVAGWKLIVTYHSIQGIRTIWAYAKFSDLTKAGSPADGAYPLDDCNLVQGGWIICPYEHILRGTPPVLTNYAMPDSKDLTPHGGRKTNGIVETADLRLMYEGPRRAIYVSESMIYDYWLAQTLQEDYTEDAVAKLVLTFDFNKDTKELTIIKDVKIELPPKNAHTITPGDCHDHSLAIAGAEYQSGFVNSKSNRDGIACIELDNNEELDQGSLVKGYAHFYTMDYTGKLADNLGEESLVTEKILTDGTRYMNSSVITPTTPTLGLPEYHWDACMAAARTNDNCRPNDRYAVAQMIEQQPLDPLLERHVIKKAFWPHPDWWTVDAYVQGEESQFFNKLEGLRVNDMATEPEVVGTSAQWNFILNGELNSPIGDNRQQWRSVETIAVTDFNNADDANIPPGGHTNVIESELTYFDNMVFNPWDLRDAVHKQYSRHVTFHTALATGGETVTLTGILGTAPMADPDFYGYASFAERVLDLTTGELLTRGDEYTLVDNGITFAALHTVIGREYKILWSDRPIHEKLNHVVPVRVGATLRLQYGPADKIDFIMIRNGTAAWSNATTGNYTCSNAAGAGVPCAGGALGSIYAVNFLDNWDEGKVVYETARGTYEWIIVGRDSNVVDSAGAAHVTEAFDSIKNIDVKMAGLDMYNSLFPTVPYIQEHFGGGYYTKDEFKEGYIHNEEGNRAHLRDDYSSIMPIDSSNIILVGGPLANLGMEMANDWGSAIYRGTSEDFYSPGQWDSMINTFPKNGYAVIGTYMDVDGTVYFYIYGGTGEDTFWATWAFYNQYITYLQTENPGVTSLLLKLSYDTPGCPPGITIVKRLDTISEKNPEQDP